MGASSVVMVWIFIALFGAVKPRPRVERDISLAPNAEGFEFTTKTHIENFCSLISWLKPHQKRKCLLFPSLMPSVQRGVGMALRECENHFTDHQWNCSGLNTAQVFQSRGILTTGSRESAYVYAITSAGVSYQITKGCANGNWDSCGCDLRVRGRVQPKNPRQRGWEWGGCSEDVKYGDAFSKKFMDWEPATKDIRYLLMKHNNEAGRKSLRDSMGKTCKCHGVSGSCTVRICWKTMPNFDIVARLLRTKFDRAIRVRANSSKSKLQRTTRGKRGKKRGKPRKGKSRRPPASSLVYNENSPDFCRPNLSLGILGTRGRACNNSSTASNGCDNLCCSRGYNTAERTSMVKCNCQFIWCCKVKCDRCEHDWLEHTCK